VAQIPTVADVRAWVQVPATSVSDAQLQQVLDGELKLQAMACRVPGPAEPPADDYPEALAQALYRRCGRELNARQVPLGVVGDGSEFGPSSLSTFDAEVERLEGPYRLVVFG
jgi:hypothetical protein